MCVCVEGGCLFWKWTGFPSIGPCRHIPTSRVVHVGCFCSWDSTFVPYKLQTFHRFRDVVHAYSDRSSVYCLFHRTTGLPPRKPFRVVTVTPAGMVSLPSDHRRHSCLQPKDNQTPPALREARSKCFDNGKCCSMTVWSAYVLLPRWPSD